MSKTKKEYDRTKERILNSKLSETEKSKLLTNNWFEYIYGSITEETKRHNLTHQSEMIFVRL